MPIVISEVDWARLAAYLDGEGHIAISGSKGGTHHHHMQITIGNTDFRLSTWLMRTFGGGVGQCKSTVRKKKYWYWHLSGQLAADALKGCLPYFIMKRDQAEIAIEFQDLMEFQRQERLARRKKRSVPFLTEEMSKERQTLMFKLREVRQDSAERVA